MELTLEQRIIKGYISNYDTRFFQKNTLFGDDFNNLLAALAYATIGDKLEDSISKAIVKEKNYRILNELIKIDELSYADKQFAGFILIKSFLIFEIECYIEKVSFIYETTKDSNPKSLYDHLYRVIFLGSYISNEKVNISEESKQLILDHINASLNFLQKKVSNSGYIGHEYIKPHYTLNVALFLAYVFKTIKDEKIKELIHTIITKIDVNVDKYIYRGFVPFKLKEQENILETVDSCVYTAHQMKYILFQTFLNNEKSKRLATKVIGKLFNEKENMLYSALLDGESSVKKSIETTPWVLLTLSHIEDSLQWLDKVFYKEIPDPPPFSIINVRSDSNNIVYSLKEGNLEWTEQFDIKTFDNIISTIVNHWGNSEVNERSPRSHGHDVLVLLELIEKSEDQHLIDKIKVIIERKLDYILRMQQSSGGWFYSQKNVVAQVFQLGKVEEYEFPNYQYTIDASVAGRALVEGYKKYGKKVFLDGAFAALEYFEKHVGRVKWKNEMIWRLWPEDEKTKNMGTGLNYELWNGWFFSGLYSICDSENIKRRLNEYINDIITYTVKRIDYNGDAIYSDPVPEFRMPYALWDAFLLIEIGKKMGQETAVQYGSKILKRTAEVMLPSGLIPFISNYREDFGKYSRWNIHSHGIGVYPVRAYYQLFHIVDEELAPTNNNDEALKSFGFYLLHFYDKVFNKFNMGLSPTGEKLNWSHTPNGGDWLVKALISIDSISNIEYKPKYIKDFPINLKSKVDEHFHWHKINNHGKYGYGLDFYSQEEKYHYPEAYALYGRGFVELFNKTGDMQYIEMAINSAKWLLNHKSNDFDKSLSINNSWGLPWVWTRESGNYPAYQPFTVTTVFVAHFLLDLYEVTGDSYFLNEIESSIKWIIEENGYQKISDNQIGFYYSSHGMDQKEVIINAHSQVLGLFARYQRITQNNFYNELISKGLAFIEEQQLDNDLWGYGTINQKVEFHQSMVLDGLIEVYTNKEYKDEKLRGIIISGLDSYQDKFFDNKGNSYLTIEKNSEGWIQHTAIGAITFYKGATSLEELKYKKMAFLILENLALNNKRAGGYYILSNKYPIQSIRGNAHMFYLLTTLNNKG